jgi:hypothetical protein
MRFRRNRSIFYQEPAWRVLAFLMLKLRLIGIGSGALFAVLACVVEWDFNVTQLIGGYVAGEFIFTIAGTPQAWRVSVLFAILFIAINLAWMAGALLLPVKIP